MEIQNNMAILLNSPEQVADEHFMMKIKIPGASFFPGQFINIKTSEGTDPLLRRPFSIFDAEGDTATIIIRVIGKGTELLSRMEPGEINVVGPTGNGFTMEENKNLLLAGGGVGNAPLFYLMKELKKRGNRITYIYCSRSASYLFYPEMYEKLADEFIITTDDGSAGVKGFATDVMKDKISAEGYDRVYCCGPDPMMKKTTSLTHKNSPVEVSVENYFGCGVGLCVGCTVDTVDGYKRACVDGPVFDGRKILWENMPD